MHTKTRKWLSAALMTALAGSLSMFSAGCQCPAEEKVPSEEKKAESAGKAAPVSPAKKQTAVKAGKAVNPAKKAPKAEKTAKWTFTATTNKPDAIYRKRGTGRVHN